MNILQKSPDETTYKYARRRYNENLEAGKHEVTQQDMAKILNVDKSIISKLESGKKPATLENVLEYHKKFDVSMEFLVENLPSVNYENIRVSSDLGITDDVADTMVMLKQASSDDMNLTAVLNAFIGNKEATYNLMNTILMYLYSEYTNHDRPSQIYDTLMTTTIIQYLNQFVKPQLSQVLKAKERCDEKRSGQEEHSIDEYNNIQNMIADCYKEEK